MIATTRKLTMLGRSMVMGISNTFRRFGAFIGKWVRRIGLATLAISGLSVKAFADFDDAMIKSLAIMGDVSEGMQQEMRDLARTISTEGVTSATDLAKSYFFLASAGLTAEQSIAALSTVEAFAVAGAFDMALATDLLTDAQSALGLTVKDSTQNMMNMTRVSDVLTGANTLANASTRQFSLALVTQAGPAMKAFNVSLEQGVAVLAAYADQGIKGQRAGTMFSRMLRLMTKGFRDNTAAWRKFGITIFDASGELLPMADIIRGLSEALGDLSTQQKGNALEMLGFMARSQQTILPLLGLGDRVEEYTRQLEKMNGITKEVHEKQLKSFSAQMIRLWNNIKDVAISIGERLAPSLVKISDWFIANKNIVKVWALIFVEHIVFVKDVLWNFVKFMKSDWRAGLQLGFDIVLELAAGFGKSLVAIMKEAARVSAEIFMQTFGVKLGKFFIDLGNRPKGELERLLPENPIDIALRIGLLKTGTKILEQTLKAPSESTLKSDLKRIANRTISEIEKITVAAEKVGGINIDLQLKTNAPEVTEQLEMLEKETIDILSGPLKNLRENVGMLKKELEELQKGPSLLEKPFEVEVTGGMETKILSIAERRVARMREMIETQLKTLRGVVAEELFAVPLLAPERIDAVLKAQKEMKSIERLAERHYRRLAEMRKRLLGIDEEGKKEGEGMLGDVNAQVKELMGLIQGGKHERFEVVRTSLVDPRSSGTALIDINRQILAENQKQTRELEEANENQIG